MPARPIGGCGGWWYVQPALRGNHTEDRRARLTFGGALLTAVAIVISSCGGGGESSGTAEAGGTYRAQVATASFPTRQLLGQTSLLRLGIRNTGERAIPAVVVKITVAGRQGRDSSLPFGFRDPQPGLAQPDRPVWVLAEGYPKRAGDPTPGGAQTSNPKTFDLGRLEPGETTEWVWKVSAVKAGGHIVRYRIGAGLTDTAKVETATGVQPGGSFLVRVSTAPPNTIVTDSGKVIQIPPGKVRGN